MDLYEARSILAQGKYITDLKLRVTFYARVSSEKDEQLNSLQNQIQYYPNHIKSIPNWTYVEGYYDEGLSGKETTKRESFNQMIDDARMGKFDLILTKSISRFARDTLDSIFNTRELLKMGVAVLFESDNINTIHEDSELRLTIMSGIAQDDLRRLSENIKFGHQRAIEKGRVLGNNRMWGYVKDDGKLVIDEKEAEIIKCIFETYCQGNGIRTVSKILAEKGYLNNKGNPFTFNTLKGIIENPKYKGFYVGNKTSVVDYRSGKRKFFDEDEWVMYEDNINVPPIVSKEIWEQANSILKERSIKMSSDDKTSYQNKFLYSGKIICMEHNTTYWRNIYKYKTIEDKEVWQCKIYRSGGKSACDSPMLYKYELDSILKSILQELFKDKNHYINKLMSMYTEVLNSTDYTKDIKELMGKIVNIKKRKNKLLDLSINNLITNDEFRVRNDEFNFEIQTIEKQIEKYTSLNDAKHDTENQLKFFKKALEQKVDFENDFNEQIAATFLDKIEVFNDGIDNLINMNVILKSGIKIPVHYLVNKNMRLLPSIQVGRNKRIFMFKRKDKNDNRKNTPETIEINVSVKFNMAA